MNIYIDESIHERADFIVTAAVCSPEELQLPVHEALRNNGFDPTCDEFKSSMRLNGFIAAQKLREDLRAILSHCKIAIAVCPVSERASIAKYIGDLLCERIWEPENQPITLHFDEGMKRSELRTLNPIVMQFDCDSQKVAGIQVADCAAHLFSTILLSELGFVNKTMQVNEVEHGFDGDIELAWSLWAEIRYALSGSEPVGSLDEHGDYEPMMLPFGLFVSSSCSDSVKAAVEKRLGQVWVGCIH